MINTILFDQDGTLLDSGPGIKNCAIRTLVTMGLQPMTYDDLDFFIGPPLAEGLRRCHVPEERLEEAIQNYRGFYAAGGMFDATIYPGIEDLLDTLKAKGYHLFVCTSKGKVMSDEILAHFGLAARFEGIYGPTLGQRVYTKGDIIAQCLKDQPAGTKAIMVGDTILDIQGARANFIPCIAVSYGYGPKQSLKEADYRCQDVASLKAVLLSL